MGITQASIRQGNEFLFAQQVVDFLELAFPGWPWTASVDGGILYILNTALSDKWGIQCRVDKVDKRGVLQHGGELLERFEMPYSYSNAALEDAKRDFTGTPISEKWTNDRRYYSKNEKKWKA
ncbi:MAG: hypothetical protein JRC90_10435 [Deltaproteobacteria bacterium]|nr:hypothetical protein [Deltaproteobacteria bacterium]